MSKDKVEKARHPTAVLFNDILCIIELYLYRY